MYAEFKYKAWYVDFIFETTAATGGSCTLPGVQQKLIRQRRIQPTSWSTTHRMAELVQSLSHHIYEMYTRHDSLWACTHTIHAPSRHVIIKIKITGRYPTNIISLKRRYWQNEENWVKLFSVEVFLKKTPLKVRDVKLLWIVGKHASNSVRPTKRECNH